MHPVLREALAALKAMRGDKETLFAVTQRSSAHITDCFKLPRDTVVEIGREIAI